jgi:DNA-binding MarR family transcriptional regulator
MRNSRNPGLNHIDDPTRGVLTALLELRLELSLLNHRVATEVGLNDVDLDCLEVISREGPTSPAQLTRRLGIHPATMTGILSRLEDSGWIVRRVNPYDRRASVLKIVARREARLRKRYASSTQAVVDAMSARSDEHVALIVEVLTDLASRARAVRMGATRVATDPGSAARSLRLTRRADDAGPLR